MTITRYAIYANDAGRAYTNVVLGDGPAPSTHTLADGTVLTLRAAHTVPREARVEDAFPVVDMARALS